jgi:hypothetical protein
MNDTRQFYCRFLALAFMLLLSSFKTQTLLAPEEIDWDTHFLADPDENSAFAALTVTTWHYDYKATVRNNNLHIDFNFVAGVDPSKSWVKKYRIRNRQVSKQLLSHEQGHVYINFLLLKNGEITIRNQRYAPNNYKRLIQQTANKISTYYSNLQDRYDEETKHGSDLNAQKRWDRYIEQQLEKFE